LLPSTSYSVSETLPAGWATQSVSVSEAIANSNGAGQLVLDPGETITVTFTNIRASIFTNTERCIFDMDSGLPGQQFRLLFTQDVSNWPTYKQTATNPGQYFYNVFYTGTPGQTKTFDVTLPYPFVTQGANPIHAYSSLSTYTNSLGQTCFTVGPETYVSDKQVVLGDYNGVYEDLPSPTGDSIGTATFPITVTVPPSGFIFIAIHLDYGLKGSLNYGGSNNNAVAFSSIATPPLKYLIPDLADHTFSVSGAQTGSSTAENVNSFKKNPGVGGLVENANTLSGIGGATVTLKKGGQAVGTAITDSDGWYQISYKHTGKAADFQVILSSVPGKAASYTQTTTVTLKANAYFQVDFDVPFP
jgi:hypothetical protein